MKTFVLLDCSWDNPKPILISHDRTKIEAVIRKISEENRLHREYAEAMYEIKERFRPIVKSFIERNSHHVIVLTVPPDCKKPGAGVYSREETIKTLTCAIMRQDEDDPKG